MLSQAVTLCRSVLETGVLGPGIALTVLAIVVIQQQHRPAAQQQPQPQQQQSAGGHCASRSDGDFDSIAHERHVPAPGRLASLGSARSRGVLVPPTSSVEPSGSSFAGLQQAPTTPAHSGHSRAEKALFALTNHVASCTRCPAPFDRYLHPDTPPVLRAREACTLSPRPTPTHSRPPMGKGKRCQVQAGLCIQPGHLLVAQTSFTLQLEKKKKSPLPKEIGHVRAAIKLASCPARLRQSLSQLSFLCFSSFVTTSCFLSPPLP